MKRVGVDRTTRWTLCIVVTTIVLSLGLSLIGARTFLRSDTVLRWAPWNESQPIDLELTSIPVADPVDSGFPAQELFHRRLLEGDLGLGTLIQPAALLWLQCLIKAFSTR